MWLIKDTSVFCGLITVKTQENESTKILWGSLSSLESKSIACFVPCVAAGEPAEPANFHVFWSRFPSSSPLTLVSPYEREIPHLCTWFVCWVFSLLEQNAAENAAKMQKIYLLMLLVLPAVLLTVNSGKYKTKFRKKTNEKMRAGGLHVIRSSFCL